MNKKLMLLFLTLLVSFKVCCQIGFGIKKPHENADIHLANKNKTIILNHVDDKATITDPYKGMIFYDTAEECFRGYANGVYTDCFGAKKSDPVVTVDGPGFKGDFFRGYQLTDAVYEITVTNNTFKQIKLGFNVTDLTITGVGITGNGGISVSDVYLAGSPDKLYTQFDLDFPAGAAKTIVYKLSGTPVAPYTQIKGEWNKITMLHEDVVDVNYKFDCSLGSWLETIDPYPVNGLVNGQGYTGKYKLPYTIDATGFVFKAFSQTSNGLILSANDVVGTTSGEIIINLSGVYNSSTQNNFLFLSPYGCTINFVTPKNCKEIKELAPLAPSGMYKIDIDGQGVGLAPMDCSCDMDTDGGGWTLILNYNRIGGTKDGLKIHTNTLPILGSEKLGINEFGTIHWGHTGTVMLSKLSFTELRFYAISNSIRNQIDASVLRDYPNAYGNDGRIMHFKTSLPSIITYVKTGTGSMTGINNSFTPLSLHSTHLPAMAQNFEPNQKELALTELPFYRFGELHWTIGAQLLKRWEVDSQTASHKFSTYHQVWIR